MRRAEGCRSLVVKVRRATVRTSTKSGGGSTGGSGGTDPQFDYCYQAKDAGYGPYYKGQDEVHLVRGRRRRRCRLRVTPE